MLKLIIISVALAILSTTVGAEEKRYVSDELKINVRTGESAQHKIIRLLTSGSEVTVLNANPETGYSHIRLSNGSEGYVLTRFLMNNPSARNQLSAIKKRLTTLEQSNQELKTQLSSATDTSQSVQSQLSDTTRNNRSLTTELERIKRISANALTLDRDNKELRERMVKLETQILTLQQENTSIKEKETKEWLLTGGGLIIGGIILGVVLPRIRFNKRSDWHNRL